MAKVCDVYIEQQQQPQHPSVVAPTPTPRRPRVREVSSRFMSPVVTSSSASTTTAITSGDLHLPAPKSSLHRQATVLTSSDNSNLYNHYQRSRSVQRARQASEAEPLRCSNETKLDVVRSLDMPLAASQLKPQRSLKLLKENGGDPQRQQLHGKSGSLGRYRPETPLPSLPSFERRTPHPRSVSNSHQQMPITSSTARQLVQLCGMEPSVNSNGSSSEVATTLVPENEDSAVPDPSIAAVEAREEGSICSTSNPSLGEDNYCKVQASVLDIRCSTPGLELPSHSTTTLPSRSIPQRGCSGNVVAESFKVPAWRYANAKAEATMNVQSHTVERSFYALLVKKSEMHDSVQRKRIELGYLKKLAMLSSIMGAQMPYLDEWSTLEFEYSSSLSGAIKALQDASVQLPISGNVKVNIGELEESLRSALNLMETVSSQIYNFFPKAKTVDTSISSLAEMVSRERALAEECGDLLTKMHNFQLWILVTQSTWRECPS
ncbi:hypothetical protein Syun_027210 [Stephania yunnanensis]|uniref:Uncharacterized protein n=1 Tax=Stephania yunnanensis TaxID=152371 RepID=A0AAP0EFJ4_9MAGN